MQLTDDVLVLAHDGRHLSILRYRRGDLHTLPLHRGPICEKTGRRRETDGQVRRQREAAGGEVEQECAQAVTRRAGRQEYRRIRHGSM